MREASAEDSSRCSAWAMSHRMSERSDPGVVPGADSAAPSACATHRDSSSLAWYERKYTSLPFAPRARLAFAWIETKRSAL